MSLKIIRIHFSCFPRRYSLKYRQSSQSYSSFTEEAVFMSKTIGVGYETFDEFILDGNYYVDKTELLYELTAQVRNKVTLFTRPRRFGKTLMMRMAESFFDIRRDSSDIFSGLKITLDHPDYCAKWMNQYPVIFITLKDVEGGSFDIAYNMLKATIADLCKDHENLLQSDDINAADAEIFQRLMFKNASEEEVSNSLKTIMRMMKAVYGKPVIVLIDEYDVPLAKAAEAKNKEYDQSMLGVIRRLLSASLKTNDFLKFAVITGCLRITKESIFTGVNNFSCFSVTNRRFSHYFGFTQDEVEEMLKRFGLSAYIDHIKRWYDGYIFGDTEVFCPWDVVSYLSSLINDNAETPRNYWANTSSNAILDEFVNHSRFDASDKFEALLNGGTITETISEELTYDRISDSEKNFWSVLLMTGYVSKADKTCGHEKLKLRLPNLEISEVFKNAVVERFNRRLDSSKADAFITAMWNHDEGTASSALSDILWNSISYFDYGEEYYHGLLNGIFTSRGYQPDSNDEAGLGRLDLRIRDRANRRILLFEFKRSKSNAELDDDCDEAIGQIIKNGYAKSMPDGYEAQIIYGIAFYGKKALVKLMK